jgi:hypothetical protein
VAQAPSPERRASLRAAASGVSIAPQFEYVGKTALTVVSPITGRHYRFERPGMRLAADVRDRSWLAFVPNLKRAD